MPALAVTVDDALLRFADCLSGVLAKAGQLKEEAVADEEELAAEEVRFPQCNFLMAFPIELTLLATDEASTPLKMRVQNSFCPERNTCRCVG